MTIINMGVLWKQALSAGLGSFILGYNIGIFISRQSSVLGSLEWEKNNKEMLLPLMTEIFLLSAMSGALLSAPLAQKYGKRKSIMIIDLLTIIGSIIMIIPTTSTFGIGRFITGFCVGNFSCLVPLYINDISPTEVSGKLGAIVQLQITLGMLISYALAVVFESIIGVNSSSLFYARAIMFLFQAIFAYIHFLAFAFVYCSETPKWLVQKKEYNFAMVVLEEIYNEEDAKEALDKLRELYIRPSEEIDDQENKYEKDSFLVYIASCKLFREKYLRLGFFLNIFQQFSGINGVLVFPFGISSDFKYDSGSFKVFAFLIMLLNFLSVVIIFPLIEKYGRKKMIQFGCVGMALCLCIIGLCLEFGDEGLTLPFLIIFLLGYIMFFEISLGPICWVYCGETLYERAMSICTTINWICTFIVLLTFKYMCAGIEIHGTFYFYSAVNMFGLIYFKIDMNETKGLEKSEINIKLNNF